MATYLNTNAILDNSINSSKIDSSSVKTINGESILGQGDINISVDSNITESTISAWGFTKNTGTYIKPSTGIPKSDLTSETQETLNKVDGFNVIAVDTDGELGDVVVPDGQAPTVKLENYYTKQEIDGKGYVSSSQLSTVATSGNYNDLSNKPTIPSAVTESTVSGWGFTKNTGTYSIPQGGIPKTDLAGAVQTSLSKADTALQSYTEQYKGTVTEVKINGTTKSPSNGVVNLGTVITSHQDISGKQDKLISGSNIKTVNGESLLGTGNITISGGNTTVDWGDIQNKPHVVTIDSNTFTTSDIYNIQRGHVTYKFTPGKLIIDDDTGDDSCSIKGHGDLIFNCNGDGTKFLANDGTYKEVVTKATFDATIGDINTILESIING